MSPETPNPEPIDDDLAGYHQQTRPTRRVTAPLRAVRRLISRRKDPALELPEETGEEWLTAYWAERESSPPVTIDLQNLAEQRLNDGGELEVRDWGLNGEPILVQLGCDTLEITALDLPHDENDRYAGRTLHIIRNLNGDPNAVVTLSNEQSPVGEVSFGEGEGEQTGILMGRSLLIIGSEATPQLQLQDADPEHLQVRIGNMSGNVHLLDLETTVGTRVTLPADAVGTKSKLIARHPDGSTALRPDGKMMTEPERRGRWLYRDHDDEDDY